jgi:hypothetical protein
MTFEHKNGFLTRVIEARKLNGHRCNKTKVESGAGKVVYRYGTGEVRAIYNYKKGQRHVVVKILQGQENASMIVFMNMEKFFLEVDYSILLKN